jgi:serine/threonine protein kinase/Tol biopolymer transport system component
LARTLEPEDRISHYRIVGPLGAGGMGEVYIAQDETLGRSVALKILPPRLVRNEERVRRFVTEAKSASSLNHPNIVTIYEIGHDEVKPARAGGADASGGGAGEAAGAGETGGAGEAVHFISMELVAGTTLDEKIHHERTDLRTLLGYLAQAAEGVAKAHQAGIVHRDLKPGNIMVSKDGFAKVLDFGLAKLTERGSISDAERTSAPTEAVATGAGVVMGTVGYMSPEQVQARTVDHRSDIFSLGCILYEAATRRRPFTGDSDVEVMHQIIKEKPPAVETLNPEVPGEVRRLIRRCLAKSPDQRFQSMKDLAIDLRELVEEWDTLSPSAPSGSTSGASSGSGAVAAVGASHGTIFWAAIVAAVVIGVGGLGFGLYALLGRGSPAGAGGSATGQDLRMSVLMSRDDLDSTALSGDGRYLAYVTVRDRKPSLNVRQVRTGSDVVILPGSETPITGLTFSPDGDYLYYLNRDPDSPNYSALFQVASLGGAPRKLIFDVDSAVSFASDGTRVCFRRGHPDTNSDGLMIAELETGKERELLRIKNPDGFEAAPVWSPDGRTIACAIQSNAGGVKSRLVLIDAETGKSAPLGTHTWLTIDTLGWMKDNQALLVSALEVSAGGAHQIYRVATPGGEVARLTNDLDGYTNLTLAADGSSVVANRRATVDNLWVARADTKQEAQPITFASGSAGSIDNLVPLPGGAAAFTAPKDNQVYLWRIDADGSNRRQLTSQGVFVINAEFAAGAGLVFTQVDSGASPLAHLWRIDPDGGGLRQLTEGNGERLIGLAPSGKALIFRHWDDPQSIWALKLDGTPPRKIVDGNAVAESLVSPDGTRVLTAVFENRNGRLYPRRRVIPIDGGEPVATFVLPPGAENLQWTPDGRGVTYVDKAEGWNLMRMTIPDGKPERLTNFPDGQVEDHRWSPDGSRIVVHRRLGQQTSVWMLKPGESKPTLIAEFKTGHLSRHYWAPDAPILYFTYGSSSQDVVMIAGIQ